MAAKSISGLLDACRDLDPEPIAQLALELVSLWTPPRHERPMADRLAEALAGVGARVWLDETFPDSPSVLAQLGADDGPCLQWHGHMDAIDAPHPPPQRRGNTITGRGAADMKGALAAMVTSAHLLTVHGVPRGRVLITFHGLHETGGNEPLHELIGRGVHGDAVLIGELGGGETLPVASLGLTIFEIQVEGSQSVHELNARPDTVNPLEVGRLLLNRLATLRDALAAAPGAEPKPSLFVGKFVCGDYFNRVPVNCTITGSRRHDESSSLADVAAEVELIVEGVRAETGAPVTLRLTPAAESYSIRPDELIVHAVRRANRDLTGLELPLARSAAAGNATTFVHEAGVPAVYFGCDYSTAHADLEIVTLDDLRRVAAGIALATHYYLAEAPAA